MLSVRRGGLLPADRTKTWLSQPRGELPSVWVFRIASGADHPLVDSGLFILVKGEAAAASSQRAQAAYLAITG
jgi:hypothetical protein